MREPLELTHGLAMVVARPATVGSRTDRRQAAQLSNRTLKLKSTFFVLSIVFLVPRFRDRLFTAGRIGRDRRATAGPASLPRGSRDRRNARAARIDVRRPH